MNEEYDDQQGRRASGSAGPSGAGPTDPTEPTGHTEPTGPADPTAADPTAADSTGPPADGTASSEQERVARILAAAGGDEPMPADVAARLDALVADLASAAPGPAQPGPAQPGPAGGDADHSPVQPVADPTDELTARRRRRRWPQLLVAAATVSVLGLGLGTLIGDLGSGGADSESTAGVAAEDAAAGGGAAEESGPAAALRQEDSISAPSEQPADETEDSADADGSRTLTTVGVPRLRTGSLDVDLQRAADLAVPAGSELARLCVRPDLSAGDEVLRVRLDGASAVLVLRAPDGGRRTAEVFTCDDADTPAASGRIDAR